MQVGSIHSSVDIVSPADEVLSPLAGPALFELKGSTLSVEGVCRASLLLNQFEMINIYPL